MLAGIRLSASPFACLQIVNFIITPKVPCFKDRLGNREGKARGSERNKITSSHMERNASEDQGDPRL